MRKSAADIILKVACFWFLSAGITTSSLFALLLVGEYIVPTDISFFGWFVFIVDAAIILGILWAIIKRRFLPFIFAANVILALTLLPFAFFLSSEWGDEWISSFGATIFLIVFIVPSLIAFTIAAPILWYLWQRKYGIWALALTAIFVVLASIIIGAGPMSKDFYEEKSFGVLNPSYMPVHYEEVSKGFSDNRNLLIYRALYTSRMKAGLPATYDEKNTNGCCPGTIEISQEKKQPGHMPFPASFGWDRYPIVIQEKIILESEREARYMVIDYAPQTEYFSLSWEHNDFEIVILCRNSPSIEDACPKEELIKIANSMH